MFKIPEQELNTGQLREGSTYRVALLPSPTSTETQQDHGQPREDSSSREREDTSPGPPVTEGEQRTVEIVDIGEQGEGIARVERGYVIIVPDTEMSEKVRIEIATVKPNLAFGEVVDRVSYYE